MSASTTPTACPSCGSPASGHFCANCGAPIAGARCAECGAALSEGAKFCHRCGTPVGAAAASPRAEHRAPTATMPGRAPGDWLPWGVAAIALLTVVALVAGQNFRAQRGGSLDGPSNAFPQAGLDDRGAAATQGAPVGPFAGGVAGGAAGAGPAPDIASMSPEERASRLFDRVMRYD